MGSYYKEIAVSPSPEDPRRLIFIAEENSDGPPADVVALRTDYDEAARVVRVLFGEDVSARTSLFEVMHRAADRGLRGSNFNIADGKSNLKDVQDTIVDQALSVRDQRFKSYNCFLLFLGIIPGLLGIAVIKTSGFGMFASWPASYTDLAMLFPLAFMIAAGATFCVWADFALRMQGGLTFDKLLTLDPSRWKPAQRITVTIGISVIFAFLLAFNVIQVGLGGLLLNDFYRKTPELSFAVGGITGLAFSAVRDIIYRLKPEEKK